MIDIHTHVLPGLDDGSASLEESLWLGHALARQGVKLFAATPHFYATHESPRDFLRRRERAERQLFLHWPQEFPPFLMGAEVRFFDGMSRTQELPLLVLEGTNLLLLEMPFSPWSSRMVEEVLEIQERRGLQVLLARGAVPALPGAQGVGEAPPGEGLDAVQRQLFPPLEDETQGAADASERRNPHAWFRLPQ